MSKLKIKRYYDPTPEKIRKWADVVADALNVVAVADVFISQHPTVAAYLIIGATVVKKISNKIGIKE